MNRTSLLILQHRRERFHPFNSARIVHQALDRCELMVGHTIDLADQFAALPLCESVGLLYPGDDARLLTELAPAERPQQLVVPDGTWHHVKTLMRDVPRLRTLPRYRLAPASPGRYRIRREPHPHALSTLEATVAALAALEPDTAGLDRLLDVFNRMIAEQLQHGTVNWRRNERRRSGTPNVPRVLTGDLSNIVVAYGEQERGTRREHQKIDKDKPAPVYWTAVRLVSGEVFQCVIDAESLGDDEFLKFLRLAPEVTQASVSVNTFRASWKAFLRPRDHVAVYHQSTAKLLDNVDAQFSPTLVLKSINVKPELDATDALQSAPRLRTHLYANSRASQRLASAVAFVAYLNRGHHQSEFVSSH